ncbi:MAG: hypothetical protein WAV00_01065 [Nocardioides sp.]
MAMGPDVAGAGTPERDCAEATFVLLARGAVQANAVLDLVDLDPSTIRIPWAGAREITCLSTGQLLDLWGLEERATAKATFSQLGAGFALAQPVRLQVRAPRIVGSGLRWTVTTSGWLPHATGACVLVLHPPEWT